MQHIDSQNETMQNDKNLKNIKNGLSNLAIKLSFFQNWLEQVCGTCFPPENKYACMFSKIHTLNVYFNVYILYKHTLYTFKVCIHYLLQNVYSK